MSQREGALSAGKWGTLETVSSFIRTLLIELERALAQRLGDDPQFAMSAEDLEPEVARAERFLWDVRKALATP